MPPADTLIHRLEELNEIGIALSQQRNITCLLETILEAAKRITNADAGTIYLHDPVKHELQFKIIRNNTLGIAMGGSGHEPILFPPLKLYDEKGHPNLSMVACYATLKSETVNITDAYTAQGFDFSGTRKFDQSTGYRSQSFLTTPIRNHDHEIIGVLQLINAKDWESGLIVPFLQEDQRLLESLASQAAIALTNRSLVEQLENFFEAFILLINNAIDDKSPYTGEHCKRVPELVMMLAEATHRTKRGPYQGFCLTEKDRHELRIAGLLHDCGKITTPVHVVDKATKLQTLFDRIHQVDTRFEVLKRDAEIAMLRAMREPNANIAQLELDYQTRIQQLDSDREFLRKQNFGGEAMRAEDKQRVQQIASYQWCNTEGNMVNFLTDNELENLTIHAGTLTAAERQIIQHHIEVTISMLESLPWPKHLGRVPEYAGGHHERMDGKGYPRGLTREQMSLQARMMGIADIFEALTSTDRPYKATKTLSECLSILGKFKLNGHIDPDLFDVFIREKVYLDFAHKFLSPEQIDDVDLTKIPGVEL